jgi:hypothetical protein
MMKTHFTTLFPDAYSPSPAQEPSAQLALETRDSMLPGVRFLRGLLLAALLSLPFWAALAWLIL